MLSGFSAVGKIQFTGFDSCAVVEERNLSSLVSVFFYLVVVLGIVLQHNFFFGPFSLRLLRTAHLYLTIR